MDVEWTLVNRAKNLAEDELDKSILKFPIVDDYRRPLVEYLTPGMTLLDLGANDRRLRSYVEEALHATIDYKSMDLDRSCPHDFYAMNEITGKYHAIACFEVIEHMTPGSALEFLREAHEVLLPAGRMFVSTPNVYHPVSFWSDATHITPYRIRHLAGWMKVAGFGRVWGYRVCQLTWRKRLRYWRYRGLLRLLNLDFAPGIVVVGEKSE
jgi:hypothetical protein